MSETFIQEIRDWASDFLEEIEKEDLNQVQIIKRIRAETDNKSTVLFNFLLERLLYRALLDEKILISPGLIKYYFNSDIKEEGCNIRPYGEDRGHIRVVGGHFLEVGIISMILDFLDLDETKESYWKYLVIDYEESNPQKFLSEAEIEKYGNRNNIREMLMDSIRSHELCDDKNKILASFSDLGKKMSLRQGIISEDV